MSNWLVHHGIQGQQWGVRNGPPYPLNRGKGKTNKKTQNSRIDDSVESGEYAIKKYKNPTIERIKMQFRADAIWSAIYSVGSYIPGLNMALYIGSQAKDLYYKKKNWYKKEGQPESLKDLPRKTEKTTTEEDLKVNNPKRKKEGGINNCVNCTVNMEMRARGYDTVARSAGVGQYTSAWKNWFDIKDSDIKMVEKGDYKARLKNRKQYANDQYNKLMNELEAFGDGARGYLGVSYEGFSAGHAMFWKVENGRAAIYDGQSGKTDVDWVISMSDPDKYRYIRLDNKKVKDEVGTMIRSNPKRGKK